jgi:two-component system, cell cycle sensor histidine kinase PleC
MNQERADRFEGRARRQAVRVIRKLVGIALFLAICMWLFIGWSLWAEYSTARSVGRTQGFNLAAALTSELSRNFDAVDAAFRSIADAVRTGPPDASDKAGWDRLTAGAAALVGPEIGIRIAGADGRLLFASAQQDASSETFDAEPHFRAHRDDPAAGLIVDAPGGLTGKNFEVSQRLESTDGQFAGEAMLLLEPGRLITLHREFDLGRRGMIVIAGTDGIVRAGYNRDDSGGRSGVGTDLNGAPYPADLAPGQTAVYSRVGRLAGIDRLITIRRLANYPLNVLIALDLDDVFGSARSHVWLVGLVGVGATALIGILTLLLGREVWRRTKREIELAYDRDRLHSAQQQIAADRARMEKTDRELMASKQTAEAANRARSQFLVHMSHELRTPLHAIIGFSELIQDQASTRPGAPPIAGYAADIWSSGRHLLELINTILDISKVESGTATLAESVFPIGELARNSLVSVRAQAEARNIAIELQLPDVKPRLRADRTRLLQVLINLLSNAVKFTPDHGRIVLSVAVSESGELVFSVVDTGIGMTEAEVAIALEPFGQVDSALSRSFEGTGLGLPLACRLTELHGGRLELTSVKGKGTTARVILPAERVLHRDVTKVGAN